MAKYRRIDADTVEKIEPEIVKISNITEQISMREKEIASMTERLNDLKAEKKAMLEAK